MKKIFVMLIAGLLVLTGCEKSEDKEVSDSTISGQLVEKFNETITKNNIEKTAEIIIESEIVPLQLATMEIKDGDFVEGFDADIKGFKKAYVIKPMIGSIPFIAYIFETEDAESFAKNLEKNANKRWNICTEADELKTAVKDNYVFFTMNPKTFEE